MRTRAPGCKENAWTGCTGTIRLAHFVSYLNGSINSWYDIELAGGARGTILTSQVADLIGIASAVLAIVFVTRLTTLQRARLEGGAGA